MGGWIQLLAKNYEDFRKKSKGHISSFFYFIQGYQNKVGKIHAILHKSLCLYSKGFESLPLQLIIRLKVKCVEHKYDAVLIF